MPPNSEALQVFYGTLPIIVTIILGLWVNNKRLDDMNKRIDDVNRRIDDSRISTYKRLDDLIAAMNAGFSDVKASIARLETRVSDLEKSNHLIRG